jgi:hypothetical protein
MTEDQLLSAIETTMRAAHQACQPYYLQLAHLWLPSAPVLRSQTWISSKPIGTHAQVDHLSIVLMADAPAPPAGT